MFEEYIIKFVVIVAVVLVGAVFISGWESGGEK